MKTSMSQLPSHRATIMNITNLPVTSCCNNNQKTLMKYNTHGDVKLFMLKRDQQIRGKLRLIISFIFINHLLASKFPHPDTLFQHSSDARILSTLYLNARFLQNGVDPKDT